MTYRTVTLDELLELLPKPKDGKAWQERIQDLTRPMTRLDVVATDRCKASVETYAKPAKDGQP